MYGMHTLTMFPYNSINTKWLCVTAAKEGSGLTSRVFLSCLTTRNWFDETTIAMRLFYGTNPEGVPAKVVRMLHISPDDSLNLTDVEQRAARGHATKIVAFQNN